MSKHVYKCMGCINTCSAEADKKPTSCLFMQNDPTWMISDKQELGIDKTKFKEEIIAAIKFHIDVGHAVECAVNDAMVKA